MRTSQSGRLPKLDRVQIRQLCHARRPQIRRASTRSGGPDLRRRRSCRWPSESASIRHSSASSTPCCSGAARSPNRDRLVEIYTGLDKDYPQLDDLLAGLSGPREQRQVALGHRRALLRPRHPVEHRPLGRWSPARRCPPTTSTCSASGRRPDVGSAPTRTTPRAPSLSSSSSQRLVADAIGGRPVSVGQTIRLSGVSYSIIGVGPAGFTGTVPGIQTDFWVPTMMVDQFQFSACRPPRTTIRPDPARTAGHALALPQGPARGRPDGRTGARRSRHDVRASSRHLSRHQCEHDVVGGRRRPACASIRCSMAT